MTNEPSEPQNTPSPDPEPTYRTSRLIKLKDKRVTEITRSREIQLYSLGFFLAFGMNSFYYGLTFPLHDLTVYKIFGWSLLSWVRVGWLLMSLGSC